MGADVPLHGLLGRPALLAAIEDRLADGGGVALHGPGGIGRSAVLEAVAAAASARGELVLWVRCAEADRRLPYAAVVALLDQVPDYALTALTGVQRRAVAAIRAGLPLRAGPPALARRLVLPALLGDLAGRTPVLIVVDDVQWLDRASAELLGFAARRRPGPRVRVVAAQRRPDPAGERRAARLCPSPVLELGVPPLAAADLIDLLTSSGLPARAASRLYAETGGNPYLALALAGAVVPWPPWRRVSLPEPVRVMLRDRLGLLPASVVDTLLVAALANPPSLTGLARAGCANVERDLRLAAAAGVVAVEGDVIRFTPAGVRAVLVDDAPPERRRTIHDMLAQVAVDSVEELRHRALRSGVPAEKLAGDLAAAARAAAGGGTAAQLFLLAADRAPRQLAAARLDWLVAAAEAAAAAGAGELAGRAATMLLAADAPAAHRVRARLVLIDLAGRALTRMDETFAAALADAGDNPALLAPVRLRLAWRALVAGSPQRAAVEAGRAADRAAAAGDTGTEAMALGACAYARRARADAGWSATLRRALALDGPVPPGSAHLGPRLLAARFAILDDRTEHARTELLGLLAVARQDPGGDELAAILCSLAEVAVRAGRCQEALHFAVRALHVTENAGLSPGPAWYTAAVAELAGGSLTRAAGFARRGVLASEQEHDTVYLRRNLHALGLCALRDGDARVAVDTLRRLRDLETALGSADPAILRWRGDLAAGLAALGEEAEAADALTAARSAARRFGATARLAGHLDRATAIVLSERGQAESAVVLSSAAAHHFARSQQPLEQGHALLVQGGAERRRRRYAAARVALGSALALFQQADAKPWAEQAERALARTERTVTQPKAPPAGSPPEDQLTGTEARIAGLVRDGATNREIATRLYLSVKTVEATLTRVYRKLGVRSRTQLTSRLGHTDPFGGSSKGFP